MRIPLYHVDAFSKTPFTGNPAAVCPLTGWLGDDVMQAIAAENNLSETAFFVPAGEDYDLRWFTPTVEVPLCGHATLAAAYVVLCFLRPAARQVTFGSKSGPLRVERAGKKLVMSLPADPPSRAELPAGLTRALGREPSELWLANYALAVFDSAEAVASLTPDFPAILAYGRNVIATAPGDSLGKDFVSRFFAPLFGVNEDPVTGSSHCVLMPYWAKRLGRDRLKARQISRRGGDLDCQLDGARVLLAGDCALYARGEIVLP